MVEPPTVIDNGGTLLATGLGANGQVLLFSDTSPGANAWATTNLTGLLGVTSTLTPALAIDPDGIVELVTRAANGHLFLTTQRFDGRTSWQSIDVTSASGGPLLIGKPVISVTSNGTSIFGRTAAGHLMQFLDTPSATRSWQALDVTTLAGGPILTSDPAVDEDPTSTQHHVTALGPLGSILEYADDNATLRFWSFRTFAVPSPVVGSPVIGDTASITTIAATLANHHLFTLSAKLNTPSSLWTSSDLSTSAGGGTTVTGKPVLATSGGHVEIVTRGNYSDYVSFDTDIRASSPIWRTLDVKASAAFSPASTALSGASIGGQFVFFAPGAMFTSTSGTGLYAVPQNATAKALNDGWPVLGDTGALGTPGAPYTGLANTGQDLLTGKAIAASGRPTTWLSFWTVSGPPTSASATAVSCRVTCATVGNYTDLKGSTLPYMVISGTSDRGTAISLPVPSGAPTDPSADVRGVSCGAQGSCSVVGSVLGTGGQRLPLYVTTVGQVATTRTVTLPVGASTSGPSVLTAVSCTSAALCVAVGTYADTVGRTQAMAVISRDGVPGTARQLAGPTGASTNPRTSPNGLDCSVALTCVAVGSFVDSGARTRPFVAFLNGDTATSVLPGTLPAGAAANPLASLTGISCGAAACTAVGQVRLASGLTQSMWTSLSGTGVGATTLITAPLLSAANPLVSLRGVSCLTTTCTAVGSALDAHGHHLPITVSIVGGQARRASFTAVPAGGAADPLSTLAGVSCTSVTLCRAVGPYTNGNGTQLPFVISAASLSQVASLGVLPATSGAANPPAAFYQASLLAGRAVGTILASYPKQGLALQPQFVIFDPEGYPDNHSGLDGPPGALSSAKWASALQGWADGLHQLNPGTHVGVYLDQYEYATYGIAQLSLPAFLAVAWSVHYTVSPQTSKLTITAPPVPPKKLVSGPNIAGVISFNDFCPSEWSKPGDFANQVSMFGKAPWNGTYNTLQFIQATQYCPPR